MSVIDLQHEQQAQVEEIEKVETVVFLLQYSNVGPAPNFFDLSMRSGRLKKERNVRVKISQLINYFARNFLKDICCPGFLSLAGAFFRICVFDIRLRSGGNSQNFLRKFLRFFVTLRCFYRDVIHRK